MAAKAKVVHDLPPGGRSVALWAGVIAPIAIWAVQMELCYALPPWLCKSRWYWVIHLATLVTLALLAFGALLSWRDYKSAGAGSPDETDGGPVARDRFLGALGVIVCTMTAILVLAQGIPSFFFDACWH